MNRRLTTTPAVGYDPLMRKFFWTTVLLCLACSGSTPLAHFTVASSQGDDSCSKLLDYCMRVTCGITNDSSIPGQAVVDLQVLDESGNVQFTQTERLDLGPGDTKSVSHDFTEVKLLGSTAKYSCVVR